MGILQYKNYFKGYGFIERIRISLLLSAAYLLPIMGVWLVFGLLVSIIVVFVLPLLIPQAGLVLVGLVYFYLLVGFARLILCRVVNQTHIGAFSQVVSGFSPLIGGAVVAVSIGGTYVAGLYGLEKLTSPALQAAGIIVFSSAMLIVFYCGLFFLADNETAGPLESLAGTARLLGRFFPQWLLWLLVYILLTVLIVGAFALVFWLVDLVAAKPLGLTDRQILMNLGDTSKSLAAGDPYSILGLIVFALSFLVYNFIYLLGQVFFAVTYAHFVYHEEEDPNQRLSFADFHH